MQRGVMVFENGKYHFKLHLSVKCFLEEEENKEINVKFRFFKFQDKQRALNETRFLFSNLLLAHYS